MAKRLAAVHVREMNFDRRQAGGGDRVADRNAGVRVSRRIDQQGAGASARTLDTVNDRAFTVGLEGFHLKSELAAQLLKRAVDIVQPRTPVDFRLAFTK